MKILYLNKKKAQGRVLWRDWRVVLKKCIYLKLLIKSSLAQIISKTEENQVKTLEMNFSNYLHLCNKKTLN